jgi:hypothetical protein
MSGSSASDFGVMKFALPFGVFQTRSRAPSGRGILRGPHARVEVVEDLGVRLGDGVAHARVVGDPFVPRDVRVRRERRLRDAGDDRRFRAQLRLAGSAAPREPCMWPMLLSIETACSPLACRSISMRPRQGRR